MRTWAPRQSRVPEGFWHALMISVDYYKSPLACELYPMVALSSYVIHLFIFSAQHNNQHLIVPHNIRVRWLNEWPQPAFLNLTFPWGLCSGGATHILFYVNGAPWSYENNSPASLRGDLREQDCCRFPDKRLWKPTLVTAVGMERRNRCQHNLS